MKTEKGKKYRYLKHDIYRIKDGWTVGEVYSCVRNNRIKDDDGDIRDIEGYDCDTFELVEEPSTEELLKRIEALEKRLQPCETAAKFKAIADHANAINDIIKNAPE